MDVHIRIENDLLKELAIFDAEKKDSNITILESRSSKRRKVMKKKKSITSQILKKAANNSESSVSKTIDAERTEQQGKKILGINLPIQSSQNMILEYISDLNVYFHGLFQSICWKRQKMMRRGHF